ncbi:hypothetical protein M1M30_gp043 [Maribacter phage Colly_1]|uniref:Uncharacterized protein n=1 Tax=Maribacter phage Colly_1 TaxID=2745691 RepID=A0A8E4UY17_9CAUD|nr:hypothetical protein M1M30_gp043 [Maribacter phage Colly_1]QQO97326.1 hypothetical protein Colly1_43 [Maribacter phage Colly_1]
MDTATFKSNVASRVRSLSETAYSGTTEQIIVQVTTDLATIYAEEIETLLESVQVVMPIGSINVTGSAASQSNATPAIGELQ